MTVCRVKIATLKHQKSHAKHFPHKLEICFDIQVIMAASIQPVAHDIPPYKTIFLESCLSGNVLTFGTYVLKSGRRSYLPVHSRLFLMLVFESTYDCL